MNEYMQNNHCHRVTTQLQLINIIKYYYSVQIVEDHFIRKYCSIDLVSSVYCICCKLIFMMFSPVSSGILKPLQNFEREGSMKIAVSAVSVRSSCLQYNPNISMDLCSSYVIFHNILSTSLLRLLLPLFRRLNSPLLL